MRKRLDTSYDALLISNMPWLGTGLTNRQAWAIALGRLRFSDRTLFVETIGWNPLPRSPKRVYVDASGAEVWSLRAWNLMPGGARPSRVYARRVNHSLTRLWLWLLQVRQVKNVVIFDPLALPISRNLRRERLVYDCLDLYSSQPQYAQDKLSPGIFEASESEVCASADVVSAVTQHLAERMLRLGATRVVRAPGALPTPEFLPRGEEPGRVDGAPRGIYVGALDSYKVDYRAFARLLEIHPTLTIDAYGSHEYLELNDSALPNSPRFNVRGSIARDTAIKVASEYDFGIIAMTRSKYSRGSFPLKTWDYLWAGVPVLAVNFMAAAEIPELASMLIVDRPSDLTGDLLAEFLTDRATRNPAEMRAIASSYSAESRVKRILS